MVNPFKGFRWAEAIPRILADFAIVQVAALLSLLSAVLLRAFVAPHLHAYAMAEMLQMYYTHTFLPLSLTFPPVFFFSGFYTKSRRYTMQDKWRQVLYGSAFATLVYLFVSFLTTRSGTLPRSSLIVFGFLVVSGTVGIRWLKWWIVDTDGSARARFAAAAPSNAPVLVVGGAGYIGSILVRDLLDSGRRVRILDSLLYGTGAIRDILDNPNLELVVGDCRNIQERGQRGERGGVDRAPGGDCRRSGVRAGPSDGLGRELCRHPDADRDSKRQRRGAVRVRLELQRVRRLRERDG